MTESKPGFCDTCGRQLSSTSFSRCVKCTEDAKALRDEALKADRKPKPDGAYDASREGA